MNESLIRTKVHIPRPRPGLVPRPRLLDRLNRAAHRKLILLSAPPGFGKSTLLSEWLATKDKGGRQKVAWLSLDPGDNDPARFFAYLLAALQTTNPALGEPISTLLQQPQIPPPEVLLGPLLNDLANLEQDLTLVLDDYHVIENETIHSALAFFIDHLPAQIHVAIATRADPPLPLPRWRARNELFELRAEDLTWNADEAAAFLNQSMELRLSRDDVAALTERTEGWIAGLQMAALSLQARTDTGAFIRSFTGSHRLVLDYLAEEILNRQPPATQEFLYQTAILDRLSASLCDAVTQRADSQSVLLHLERSNLFVIPLDDERHWYRYHRLFADLLQRRLLELQPDLFPALHRRASTWYEQDGQYGEAIEHALAAKDFESAARLMDHTAETVLATSQVVTFLNWVGRAPEESIRSRPTLRLSLLWARLLNGQRPPELETVLQELDSAETHGPIAALRSYTSISRGDAARAAEHAREALQVLPAEDALYRPMAAWLLSVAHIWVDDFKAGKQSLYESMRASPQSGHPFITVASLVQLAEVHYRQGQLRQTRTLYEQAIAAATIAEGSRLPIACRALIGLAELHREWNDFDAAMPLLDEAIELGRQWRASAAAGAYIVLARIRQAQGDQAGANEAAEQAWQLALKDRGTELDDWSIALYRAELWIAQGNLQAAQQWANERGLGGKIDLGELDRSDNYINYRLRKYEYLTLARLLIAQNRGDAALAVLTPLAERMQQRSRMRLVVEAWMLQALAFHSQHENERARGTLERALVLAEPEGYARLFLDEGAPMQSLIADCLQHAEKRNRSADGQKERPLLSYCAKLLSAFQPAGRAAATAESPRHSSTDLVEPLSPREIKVLQLLAAGLSNKDMARELVVADETVKQHLKNIYGKLGAHSRTQALARARELYLL